MAKKLCQWPYKITKVQVTEEGDYERRMYFCNWFLQLVYDRALDTKLKFFTDKAWFNLSGYINAQKNRYWTSINQRQTSAAPSQSDQCVMRHYCYMNSKTHVF